MAASGNGFSDEELLLGCLISNSSEALDKSGSESLTEKSEPFVKLVPDKANNTLSIIDNGCGITKFDLVIISDVIAKSEPKDFYWYCTGTSSRFLGVFHRAHLVAEKFSVTTKHKDDEQYILEQKLDGSFTVTRDFNGEQLGRGTKITLFFKDDQLQYLEERRIKEIVRELCVSVGYSIFLWTEISDDKGDVPKKEEEGDVEDIDEEKEKESKKKKEVKEVSHYWQLINKQHRICTSKRQEIAEETDACQETHGYQQPHLEEKKDYVVLCQTMKDILRDKVKAVVVSESIGFTACRWVADEKILEINAGSAIIEEMRKRVEADQNDKFVKDLVLHLYETALLTKPGNAGWRKCIKSLTLSGILNAGCAVVSCATGNGGECCGESNGVECAESLL